MVTFMFYSCQTDKKPIVEALTAEEKEIYILKGKAIADLTQKALGQNLMKAMAEGGPVHALTYCNVAAIPLTDSLSKKHGVEIHRISDQYRNTQNKPDKQASEMLEYYQKINADNETLEHLVKKMDDGSVHFYAPIKVGGLCLQCHGKVGETVADSTYAQVMKLYPKDLAINYKIDDLRGIWDVKFSSEIE